MLTFSSSLQTTLNGAATKTAWANAIATALGATRAVRCRRDANAAAADPWATGTEFIHVALTGSMTVTGGIITGFGTTGAFTTRLAADLSTGVSVLRIEGNGQWVQGTLGLPGSGADFIIPSSPTTGTGIAFSSAMQIRPPRFLPSGVGPAVPLLDSSAPATLELYDWTDPVAPVLAGTLAFNTRRDDFTFQDNDLATEMGDIRVTQSTQSIIHGNFEFGATMLSMNAALNADAAVPLHQVLIGCKPYNTTWTTYPAFDTHDITQHTTFPNPFKCVLKDGNGNVLHTFEMRDGLPINSPSCSQRRDGSNAVRPHFNCGMLLPWQSHTPKVSTKKDKFYSGHTEESWRESVNKNGPSANGAFPLTSGTVQINSLNNWFAMPQWPQPSTASFITAGSDPYLFNILSYYSGGGEGGPYGFASHTTGWGYEPGANGGHDWLPSPGGVRADRAVAPVALALWARNPTGTYLFDGVSYRAKADAFGKNYFNHSHHYLLDVKTFQSIPVEDIWNNGWSYSRAYYGGNDSYVTGGKARSIAQYTPRDAARDAWPMDYTGHLVWGGWSVDYLHAYAQPGWWALIFNSPMHAISGKHRVAASFLSQLGGSGTTTTAGFMERLGAWRWFQWVMAWKMASTHPLMGMDRAAVEKRFQQDMEAIHALWVVPTTDPSHPSYNQRDYRMLRAIGQPTKANAQNTGWTVRGSGLAYYMAHVWALMKNFGLWDVMYNKSVKCQETLDFMLECFDKYSIDFILDTDGREEVYTRISALGTTNNPPEPYPFTSWAEWGTYFPKTGVEDWITAPDGAPYYVTDGSGNKFYRAERDVAQHLRAQWAFMRRDYFPEFANPRLEAACAKYAAFYDAMTARVAAEPVVNLKRNIDWAHRWPQYGILKPPVA